MKLRAEQLKKLADDAGVTIAQLGAAVDRTGIKDGESAVRNWMAGRDHPRCKKADMDRLADAIGCEPKDIARFTSGVNHHRGSPKKAKLVVDMVRGMKVDAALNALTYTHKRASVNVLKALNAAIADAEQNDADVTRLVVVESRVDRGKHIKRFQPKDRGRAHPILKRTSHITVAVEEQG